VNVLFILEHYAPYIGGVEKLFKKLSEKLADEGHGVRVITTKFSSDLESTEIVDGVEIIRIPLKNRYLFTFFGFFFCLKYSRGFDFIHTTSYNAALPAYLVAMYRRIPSIITFHEVWGRLWFSLPYLGSVERCLFFLYEQFVIRLPFDFFIGVSSFTEKSLLEYKRPNDVRMVYNGLEYLPCKKVPQTREFLFFGRLGVSKGIDLLLGAADILVKDGIDFSLTMVVPKVPEWFYRKISDQIASSAFADRITMKHNLSDQELKSEILRIGTVIIPSYSEGFCFAAAEVCALGAKIIHSGKGALAEVVSGKHIKMKHHSAKGLAEAMEQALSNNWEETPLKYFHLRDTVQNYMALYQSLLK